MEKIVRKILLADKTTVSSVWAVPSGFRSGHSDALVLAHGAGNDMNSDFISFMHNAFSKGGLLTVKFNFPYMEVGRKAPDSPQRLEGTWRTILEQIRKSQDLQPRQVFAGGKSLGGRIASQVVSQGDHVDGLVLFGYPLHPPGRPAKLRISHFNKLDCPILFIEGTRDPFCQLGLLERALAKMSVPASVHTIEDGDHSFRLPRRSGRTEREVWEEIVSVVMKWIHERSNDVRAQATPVPADE